jgi:1,4-dihydroxy-2-naphthoate octaprenyltransferase
VLSALGLPTLGLGYTAPPLRLCWRVLGEIDVAFTHSALVIVFGYVLGGGADGAARPWLISIPLFCAVFAAITLSGLPDVDADHAAGKRTLAVRLGQRRAVQMATSFTIAAMLTGLLAWRATLPTSPIVCLLGIAVVAHGIWRWRDLVRMGRQPRTGGRIDQQMRGALAFIM